MKQSEILFVAIPPITLEVTLEAAHRAFPTGQITFVANLDEALRMGTPGGSQLLVLGSSEPAAVAVATQATDRSGFPRWAVVVLGQGAGELAESVSAEEWNPPLLSRVFRGALMQHELLCENMRLRGDLKTVARRISHDLRTPIGCIQTTAEILKDVDAVACAGLVEVITQSAGELSRIIDRVSFVLKASADPSLCVRVEMGAIVATVLRQLATEIQAKKAEVLLPPSWPDVAGIDAWLQVIWWNFISNALQFGGPKPRITVAASVVQDEGRFTITDRGPGVGPARKVPLFSPFDQLHGLPTGGLGLAMVERLVSLQKGRCGYEEVPGGGSCFYFTLPLPADAVVCR